MGGHPRSREGALFRLYETRGGIQDEWVRIYRRPRTKEEKNVGVSCVSKSEKRGGSEEGGGLGGKLARSLGKRYPQQATLLHFRTAEGGRKVVGDG